MKTPQAIARKILKLVNDKIGGDIIEEQKASNKEWYQEFVNEIADILGEEYTK